MEPQMDNWNEDRLDELNQRTDAGFKDVEGEFKAVRQEIKELSQRTDAGFTEVKGEVKDVREELHRLNNTLLLAGAGIIAAIIGTGTFG